jgi:Macrocin-O-methyltransferase (TylF)
MGVLNYARKAFRIDRAEPAPAVPQMPQAVPYAYICDPAKLKIFTDLSEWRARNYVGELDPVRVINFIQIIEQVADLPDGDYIEMGTQYGGTAKLIHDLMLPDRHLFCFDTFEGFPQADLDEESKLFQHGFTTESIRPLAMEIVRDIITDQSPSDRLTLVKGRVPETLAPYEDHRWRFAHLDMDLYEPTRAALEWLWPRMVPGGIISFHDYGALQGVRKAVDDFVRPLHRLAIPMGDRFGSAVICR